MPTTIALCVPQWQGSSHPDARLLADGARATANLLPASVQRIEVPVSTEDGPTRSGVKRLDVLAANLELVRDALGAAERRESDIVLTLGGDCGVDLAPIAAASARYGPELTLVWIDAHGDLNSPATSPSGSFHGMVLRTLLGDGPTELVPARPLLPEQVVLAGVRVLDPGEREHLESTGMRRLGVGELEALGELRGPIYVHLDVDVLDPLAFSSMCYPEKEGATPPELARALAAMTGIVGIGITEHAPSPTTAARDAVALRALIDALLG